MNVRELYTQYRILPGLQLHQLRVAGIGKYLVERLAKDIDGQAVILACLFHDMGNIIKSDLTKFPEFLAEQGDQYWRGVQEEFVAKYGGSAHEANVAIAREIGLPLRSVQLIDGVGFGNMAITASGGSWEQKIVEYADCRVGPHGILPLQERLEEARGRYLSRGDRAYYTEEGFVRLSRAAQEIERQLFAELTVAPSDIDDAAVAPYMEKLWDYQVS